MGDSARAGKMNSLWTTIYESGSLAKRLLKIPSHRGHQRHRTCRLTQQLAPASGILSRCRRTRRGWIRFHRLASLSSGYSTSREGRKGGRKEGQIRVATSN